MDTVGIGLILLVVLFGLLGLGVWVGVALCAVGLVGIGVFTSTPPGLTMANQIWSNMASWTLTALPLFIWMGEILFRSRISGDLFRGLAPWMQRLPGQLLHVNVVGSGIFAAFSGSSSATCATIGKVSLPELQRRGYPEAISLGSLSGSSTLGLLIPPSIIMIVYGVAADVSIAKLFVAGILPGAVLDGAVQGLHLLWALAHPGTPAARAGRPSCPSSPDPRWPLQVIPAIGLIGGVIGSIYGGHRHSDRGGGHGRRRLSRCSPGSPARSAGAASPTA